jgi:hypothetical protein
MSSLVWAIQGILTGVFDGVHAVLPGQLGLIAVSAVTGIVMLVLYKYTSPQKAIRKVKDRVHARILEMRLFKDNFGTMIKAMGGMFAANFMYFGCNLLPLILLVLLVIPVCAQLNMRFGYRSLDVGDRFVLTVKTRDLAVLREMEGAVRPNPEGTDSASPSGSEDRTTGEEPGSDPGEGSDGFGEFDFSDEYATDPYGEPETRLEMSEVTLTAPEGIKVETYPMRVPGLNETSWRLLARQEGVYELEFTVGDRAEKKSIYVGDAPPRLCGTRYPESDLLAALLYPCDPPLETSSPIQWISIVYEGEGTPFLFWRVHWLVVFCVVSLVAAFLLKGKLKVTV